MGTGAVSPARAATRPQCPGRCQALVGAVRNSSNPLNAHLSPGAPLPRPHKRDKPWDFPGKPTPVRSFLPTETGPSLRHLLKRPTLLQSRDRRGGSQGRSSCAGPASALLFSLFFLFLSFLLLFPLVVGAGAGSLPKPSCTRASLGTVLAASPRSSGGARGSCPAGG